MYNETVNNNTTNNTNLNIESILAIIDKADNISAKSRAELKADLTDAISAKEQASAHVIDAREKASLAKLDTFSNEKGRELNKQYGDYIEGSIKENFDKKVELNNQALTLEESKLQVKLQQMEMESTMKLQKMESEAGMKIQKMFFDADLELQKKKDELKRLSTSKLKYWVWRIFWPLLGAGAGTLAFYLLYILK